MMYPSSLFPPHVSLYVHLYMYTTLSRINNVYPPSTIRYTLNELFPVMLRYPPANGRGLRNTLSDWDR